MIRLLSRLLQSAARFQKDKTGSVAIEFMLIAPILVFGFIAMTDIGLAIRDRMALDHIVRVGAQNAVETREIDSVLRVLNAASVDSLKRSASAASLSLGVNQECTCPEAPNNTVDCTTTCSGQQPTFIFYVLRANAIASGFLLPDMPISSRAHVQIR